MNSPIQTTSVVLLLIAGSWYFSRNYDVHGLESIRIEPRNGTAIEGGTEPWGVLPDPSPTELVSMSTAPVAEPSIVAPARYARPIRIASFNLQGFGRAKADKPVVLDQVARLCRQFDVVALQGLDGPDRDLMPRLVEAMNRVGGQYDALELPDGDRYRLAFVFDTRRLQTDRRQLYRVADPNREMAIDPLVGWFRTQGVPSDQAWTFSLVNVWIQPERATQEAPLAPALIRAVQNDGRHEDDVILAGSFSVETIVMQRVIAGVAYEPATVGTASDLNGQQAFDHILVPSGQRLEFTGRSGAIDFLRLLNLSMSEAEEVSSHLPVWAEFTAEEAE